MGREVTSARRCAGEMGFVNALLESDEIIFRGEIKRHERVTEMADNQIKRLLLRGSSLPIYSCV